MTAKPGVAIASLTVNRDEFLEGLQRFKRHVKKKKVGPGTFRFQDGELRVEVEGMEITERGVGQWGGEAVVPGAFVLALASSAPDGDPIPVRVEADRLHVASTSIRCYWLLRDPAPKQQPVVAAPLADTRLLQILSAAEDRSDEVLERSGFLPLVRDARKQRDVRIGAAVQELGALGVTTDHVVRLVEQCIRAAAISGAGDKE